MQFSTRRMVTIALVSFALGAMAYGLFSSSEPQAAPATVEQQAAALAPSVTTKVASAPPAEDRVQTFLSRSKKILEFDRALKGGKSDWEAVLDGTAGAQICQLDERFRDIDDTIYDLDHAAGEGQIRWDDVDVSPGDAKANHIRIGLEYAKEAVRLIGTPYTERKKLDGCRFGRDGSYDLTETGRLLEDVRTTLVAIGKIPEYVGSTAKLLRTLLRIDYKVRLADAMARGDMNEYEDLRDGAIEWKFKPEEIEPPKKFAEADLPKGK